MTYTRGRTIRPDGGNPAEVTYLPITDELRERRTRRRAPDRLPPEAEPE
ncbi:hypothetical protein [Streptomyces buecherae]